ncbi:MAG: hypothetical protein WAN14_00565 [Candidatus Acidiferrales bacterium]
MLSLLLWRAGLVVEFLILIRAVRSRMVTKFPYFYSYVFCVFCVSLGLYIGDALRPGFYDHWYWPTQFATLVAGCGVALDVVRHAFGFYPGAERVAWLACLGIFGATFCYVGLKSAKLAEMTPLAVTVELERDLRVIEALLLVTILAIVFYYGIALGRNLVGVIVGFGTYVGVSLVTLAVRAFLGPRFNAIWVILQSGAYLFSLAVWMIALWSYSPQPVPADRTRIDDDYEALVGATRQILGSLRSYFKRTARS